MSEITTVAALLRQGDGKAEAIGSAARCAASAWGRRTP